MLPMIKLIMKYEVKDEDLFPMYLQSIIKMQIQCSGSVVFNGSETVARTKSVSGP